MWDRGTLGEGEKDIQGGPRPWKLGSGSHKKWGLMGSPQNRAPKRDLQSKTTLCFSSPQTETHTHANSTNTDQVPWPAEPKLRRQKQCGWRPLELYNREPARAQTSSAKPLLHGRLASSSLHPSSVPQAHLMRVGPLDPTGGTRMDCGPEQGAQTRHQPPPHHSPSHGQQSQAPCHTSAHPSLR